MLHSIVPVLHALKHGLQDTGSASEDCCEPQHVVWTCQRGKGHKAVPEWGPVAEDTSGLKASLMVEVNVEDCWAGEGWAAGEGTMMEGQLLLRLPSMARLCLSLQACSRGRAGGGSAQP